MKKNIYFFAFAAMAFLSLSACQKESFVNANEGQATETLTVGVRQEKSKLLLKDGETIQFVTRDKIQCVATDGGVFVSEQAGKQSETVDFLFNDWPVSADPAYFVFNNSAQTKVDTVASVGTDIQVNIPSRQDMYDVNSFARYAAVLVGKAEKNDGAYSAVLKNVCGYVKVAFDNFDGIHSVKLSSKDGEALAGCVKISKSSIDGGEPAVEVVGGIDNVYITPIGSGSSHAIGGPGHECFKMKDDAVFYFAVIPGTFTPVVTFTDTLGRTATKTASASVTVTRAEALNIGTIDAKLNFEHPVVPDDIEISLDFVKDSKLNWDLVPECPTIADTATKESSTLGEVYYYNYEGKYPLPVTINKGETYNGTAPGYYGYKTTGLKFNALKDWIKFPVIPGKQLSEVYVKHENSSERKVSIIYGDVDEEVTIEEKGSHTFIVNYPGEVKMMRKKNTGAVYSHIKLKYIPVAEVPDTIVIGFAAGTTPSRTGLATTNDGAQNKAFLLDGYMFRPGPGIKCNWRSSNPDLFLSGSAGYLILPKLMGYRLSMIHMESVQESAKAWQLKVGKTFEGSKKLQGFSLSKSTPTDIQVCDPYCSENEYYLNTLNTGVSIAALQLTFEKL